MTGKLITYLILATGMLLLSFGCGAPVYNLPRTIENPQLLEECLLNLDAIYPDRFKLVQRILLEVDGKQYDFIAYMKMSRGEGYHTLVMNEMGGKLFEFKRNKKEFQIIKQPNYVSQNPVLSGPMKDILHLYDFNTGEPSLVKTDDDKTCLLFRYGENRFSEYFFKDDGKELVSSLEVASGKITREAKYYEYQQPPGFSKNIAKHIILQNHQWRYTLDIRLLEIDDISEEDFLIGN